MASVTSEAAGFLRQFGQFVESIGTLLTKVFLLPSIIFLAVTKLEYDYLFWGCITAAITLIAMALWSFLIRERNTEFDRKLCRRDGVFLLVLSPLAFGAAWFFRAGPGPMVTVIAEPSVDLGIPGSLKRKEVHTVTYVDRQDDPKPQVSQRWKDGDIVAFEIEKNPKYS